MKVLCLLFTVALGIAGNHASSPSSVDGWDSAVVPVDFHHPQLDPFRSVVIPEGAKLYADSPFPINFHDPQLVRFISNVAPYQTSSQVTKNLVRQLGTAVMMADLASIRQVVECSLCHEHLNVDTVATLECGHTFHKACYMGYREKLPGRIRCPLCRKIVSREPGNGQSFLFETLRLFEKKQYILPLERLFPDSISGIDFRDVQLVKFVSSTNTDGRKTGVVATTILDFKSAVENHNIDALRNLLECPICLDNFYSRSLATLGCQHTFHKHCLVDLNKNICPLCRQGFQGIPAVRQTFLSETVKLLEAKQYIMPRFPLFPNSPRAMNLDSPELANLISSANLVQEGSDYSKAVMRETVLAVKERSLDRLREVVTCPICRKPYTVSTLVTLNCHHSMHEGCYMRHRITKESCPIRICESSGPHTPLMRPSFLRDVMKLLEGARYMQPPADITLPTDEQFKKLGIKTDEEKGKLENLLLTAYRHSLKDPKLLDTIRLLTQCPICMESVDSKTFVMLKPCGHVFHQQCVTVEGATDYICPICRMIDKEELDDDYLRATNDRSLRIALSGNVPGGRM